MKKVFYFLVAALMAGCYGATPENTGKEGKLFPEFSMQLTDSLKWFNTATVPFGNPSALFYFGPRCPYSKAQMKEIIEDMDRLKDIHFYLVTISPFDEMRQFYKEFNLQTYPNITVGRDTATFVGDYYEVVGVPFIAVYNKNKILRKAFLGQVYSKQIIAATLE